MNNIGKSYEITGLCPDNSPSKRYSNFSRFLLFLICLSVAILLFHISLMAVNLGILPNDPRQEETEEYQEVRQITEQNISNPVHYCPACTKELDFMIALNDVHSARNWTKNVYMCRNFSNAYISAMEELGYDAIEAVGKIRANSTKKHSWVELTLTIDPGSGRIIKSNENYYIKDGEK